MKIVSKYCSYLNVTFFLCCLFTTLIIFGYLPREVAFFVAFLYYSFLIFSPTEKGVSLIIRSIPLFIALPITDSFDNFNIWRIAILLIFLKWGIEKGRIYYFIKRLFNKEYICSSYRNNKLEVYGSIFLLLTALSVLIGVNVTESIIRVIYIANIVALFVVVRSLVSEKAEVAKKFCYDFIISIGVVLLFGFVQFSLSYFTDIGLFHFWWSTEVSMNQFGSMWSNIVLNSGNTWFSYSGEELRLRMFSIFPDTHSFPMFVIMGIPALFTLLFVNNKLSLFNDNKIRFWKKLKVKNKEDYIILFLVFFAFLSIILSGTRGIWVAFLLPMVLVLLILTKRSRPYGQYVVISFVIFAFAMATYIGIGSFKQFQDSETGDASISRLQSVFDFGETSNSGRIYIWKKTIQYIVEEPVWGVGIANYPFILRENMTASLAGSSAHNIYLHIASTTGVPSAIFFMLFLYEIIKRGMYSARKEKAEWMNVYQVATGFAVLWLAMYLMTDSALFDARAFMAFMVMVGVSAGLYSHKEKLL